jgi:hypothetical protein
VRVNPQNAAILPQVSTPRRRACAREVVLAPRGGD